VLYACGLINSHFQSVSAFDVREQWKQNFEETSGNITLFVVPILLVSRDELTNPTEQCGMDVHDGFGIDLANNGQLSATDDETRSEKFCQCDRRFFRTLFAL